MLSDREKYLSDDSAQPSGEHPEANPLSEREMEVARLLATGASNTEIARDLVISPHTVKVHLRNIFDKLQVSSRTEATMLLVQRGWIVLPGMVRVDEAQDLSAAAPVAPSIPPPAPLEDLPARIAPWQRIYLFLAIGVALAFLVIPFLRSGTRSSPPLLSDAGVRGSIPQITLDDRWQALPPLPTERSRHAVVLVGQQLLVFGGETNGGRLLRSVHGYDLAVNRWQELASLPVAVSNLSAAAEGTSVYLAGGTLAQADGAAGVAGTVGTQTDSAQLADTLWRYDVEGDEWSEAGKLPLPLAGAVLVAGRGSLYLVGGWDGEAMRDEIWRLVIDPEAAVAAAAEAAATQAAAGNVLPDSPLTVVPQAATLTAVGATPPQGTREKATASGSATPATKSPAEAQSAEFFPAERWEVVARLPVPRAFPGAVLVGSRLYVAGGFDGQSELARVDAYDLDAERWEDLAALDVARSGFSLVFDGVALVAIGGGWLDTVVQNERLDPAINVWTPFPSPLQGSWRHLGAVSADGNLYLMGGWSGDYLNTFVQYQSTFRALLPVITNP